LSWYCGCSSFARCCRPSFGALSCVNCCNNAKQTPELGRHWRARWKLPCPRCSGLPRGTLRTLPSEARRGEARRIINGAREQQASKKKGEGFSSVVASIATSAAEAEFSGKGGGGVSPPQQTPSISHAEPRSLTFLVYKSLSPSRLQLWESVFSVVAIELEVEAARSRPRFTKFFSNAVKGGRLGIWSIKRCRVSLSISSSRWK